MIGDYRNLMNRYSGGEINIKALSDSSGRVLCFAVDYLWLMNKIET